MFIESNFEDTCYLSFSELDYGPSFSKLKDDRVTVEYF